MTKVGRLIFEDGLTEGKKEGKKEERIIAVINMLGFNVPENKILTMYSEEELKAAKESMKQRA